MKAKFSQAARKIARQGRAYWRWPASLGLLSLLAGGAAAQAPIQLTVDATQAPMKIIRTHMRIPVSAGPMTLLYPKWIPGEHEPSGPIVNFTGLHIAADNQPIAWTRDTLDMFAFHITVPAGVNAIAVDFDYLEGSAGTYTSGDSATAKLIDLNWNQNLLYPAGTPADRLTYAATLQLPPNWQEATPLPVAAQEGGETRFQPVSLTELVDSPVIAGEYFRAVDITPPGEPIHHELDLVADSAAALAISPTLVADMTNLVRQSGLLFGTRHYRSYRFLLTLSDHVAHFGLEDHECDDSRLPERTLIDGGGAHSIGELLPHEFMHSWNGKFRRPADLASPPYDAPEQTDLLWVYEGLTDYLGNVEATRSGLWSEATYHGFLADIAAELGPGRPGRTWRPLLDTTIAEPEMADDVVRWLNWRRGDDYYDEGDLLWLEVATIIDTRSHGAKSLEDFLRDFYGGPNNGPELKTYTESDLETALNAVVPYDWAGFFHDRLTSTSPQPPLGGVENGGWKVSWGDNGDPDPLYTLGLQLGPDGTVIDSLVDAPAYKAGITAGMRISGVNGRVYTPQRLADAIVASPGSPQPIQLLVINDDYFSTALVDYHGGPSSPQLERENDRPDMLDKILRPLN